MLTVVNAASVKLSTRVQDVFTVAKLIALVMVIIIGVIMLAMGKKIDDIHRRNLFKLLR